MGLPGAPAPRSGSCGSDAWCSHRAATNRGSRRRRPSSRHPLCAAPRHRQECRTANKRPKDSGCSRVHSLGEFCKCDEVSTRQESPNTGQERRFSTCVLLRRLSAVLLSLHPSSGNDGIRRGRVDRSHFGSRHLRKSRIDGTSIGSGALPGWVFGVLADMSEGYEELFVDHNGH